MKYKNFQKNKKSKIGHNWPNRPKFAKKPNLQKKAFMEQVAVCHFGV
jgi:hypothetical protein